MITGTGIITASIAVVIVVGILIILKNKLLGFVFDTGFVQEGILRGSSSLSGCLEKRDVW